MQIYFIYITDRLNYTKIGYIVKKYIGWMMDNKIY